MPDLSNSPQLVAAIMAVLIPAAPYLAALAEGAAKGLGESMPKQAAALFNSIRNRFRADKNKNAETTLELFLAQPATLESALTTFLLAAVEQNPDWADDVREQLAQPSLQEIIARNHSHLERVTQTLSGPGVQRIETDNSTLIDVHQTKQ